LLVSGVRSAPFGETEPSKVTHMVDIELLAGQPIGAVNHATPAVDADLDARWIAWVARGRAHDRHVRRKFIVWASVFAIGAAIVYAFLG